MPLVSRMVIIKNVGLGEGSALPVGVPVPWPSATPPTG
ncbi:phage tail protein, partial [Escherichia coli]|nr:phage tail protein [Escherichia coli]